MADFGCAVSAASGIERDGSMTHAAKKGSDTRGPPHGFRHGHGRINAGMYLAPGHTSMLSGLKVAAVALACRYDVFSNSSRAEKLSHSAVGFSLKCWNSSRRHPNDGRTHNSSLREIQREGHLLKAQSSKLSRLKYVMSKGYRRNLHHSPS